jgi:hypothetical protein
MGKYVTSKKIVVKSSGWIDMIGVIGPVLSPFVCDTKKIMHMVNTNKDVYERLDNDTELKLDRTNYELDNNAILAAKAKQAKDAANGQGQTGQEDKSGKGTENTGTDNQTGQQTEQTATGVEADKANVANTQNNVEKNKTYNDNKKNNNK